MRKRKRRTNTPPSMEQRTDTDTRTGNPGVDVENWDGTKAGTAKISRNITARGLDEANAELVTEVRHARQDKKEKLCDRWTDEAQTTKDLLRSHEHLNDLLRSHKAFPTSHQAWIFVIHCYLELRRGIGDEICYTNFSSERLPISSVLFISLVIIGFHW